MGDLPQRPRLARHPQDQWLPADHTGLRDGSAPAIIGHDTPCPGGGDESNQEPYNFPFGCDGGDLGE